MCWGLGMAAVGILILVYLGRSGTVGNFLESAVIQAGDYTRSGLFLQLGCGEEKLTSRCFWGQVLRYPVVLVPITLFGLTGLIIASLRSNKTAGMMLLAYGGFWTAIIPLRTPPTPKRISDSLSRRRSSLSRRTSMTVSVRLQKMQVASRVWK